MTIRDFRQADFKKGLLECLNALSETKFKTRYVINVFTAARAARGIRTFVMTDVDEEGKQIVVGTYSLMLEPKFIHGGSWVGHIEDVCVCPKHQGKGIGKALIDHAIHVCRSHKCYKVVLHCSRDLIAFYERAGFYLNGSGMRLDINSSEDRD